MLLHPRFCAIFHKKRQGLQERGCVIIYFSSADDADDADFLLFLYPIGYNLSALSASSADEKLNNDILTQPRSRRA